MVSCVNHLLLRVSGASTSILSPLTFGLQATFYRTHVVATENLVKLVLQK